MLNLVDLEYYSSSTVHANDEAKRFGMNVHNVEQI